jgi:hypothetical protein
MVTYAKQGGATWRCVLSMVDFDNEYYDILSCISMHGHGLGILILQLRLGSCK